MYLIGFHRSGAVAQKRDAFPPAIVILFLRTLRYSQQPHHLAILANGL
jgi:hypothetical protein